jgi:hypothetical protein
VFPSTCLAEECVEGVVTTSSGLITGHLAVWLDTMLEAEQFPTRVPDLHTPLADMEANALTHGYFGLYAS